MNPDKALDYLYAGTSRPLARQELMFCLGIVRAALRAAPQDTRVVDSLRATNDTLEADNTSLMIQVEKLKEELAAAKKPKPRRTRKRAVKKATPEEPDAE